MKFLFILLFLSNLTNSALAEETRFAHPSIMHTKERLSYVQTKISNKEEPWQSAWEEFKNSRYLTSNWKPRPYAIVRRGPYNRPDIGSSEFSEDGNAAYTHSLNWALTQDETSAHKASEILDAWSSTLQKISDHDARLLVGMSGLAYITAAELLTHTWDGWPVEQQAHFAKMLREIWYPIIEDFHPTANGNWDASMMQTMAAIGVFLDDQAIFNRAITYFQKGKGNGAVANYFKESGQCQESGRDQAHTQMGLEFLVNTCEIAWLQGIDLYGAHNNRLLAGFEYTAKYNLGNEVPYQPYRSYQDRYYYKQISKKARGKLRPTYEKPLHHYAFRKNLSAPFTEEVVRKKRPESGHRQTLPWSTLMFGEPLPQE